MKITIVSGARPNFMKIAPICRAIQNAGANGKNISYLLVYAGPEDDPSLEESLFFDLGMEKPDAYLGVSGQDYSQIAAAVMLAFEKELDNHPAQVVLVVNELTENPAHVVLVVDDLTATMSCAIVAKKRGLKVAHLIAGTRSFDMNMPREVNRTIVDAISDYLFTAGMVANRNLNQEGMIPEYIHHVGNILIDTLRYNRPRLSQPAWFDCLGIRKKNYLLLTLNRHDLLNRRSNLEKLLRTLLDKAEGLPVIAPLHGYAETAVKALGLNAPNLHILPPQSYLHFGFLVDQAKGIITDSGNIAEEATFLDVPCITLNSYAEHPETWRTGTNELVGEDPSALAAALNHLMHGEWKHQPDAFLQKISYCSMLFQRTVDSPQTSGRFSPNERSIQPQRAVDSASTSGRFQKGIKPCLLYAPVHEDFPSFSFPGTHKFRKDVLSHAGYRTHILS